MSHLIPLKNNEDLKKLLYIYFLLLFPIMACGQKRQIQAAKDQLKSGKDLEKVEKSMRLLLSDSANRRNTKIWSLLCESLMKQYDQGNEKLYLKEKYDTTKLFNITQELYRVMSSLDTIDCQLGINGRVKPRFREKNAFYLNSIRPNLFNGGAFFVHKNMCKEAYSYFEDYIKSADYPLFQGYNYTEKDALIPHAAYWSMYCGYKLNDPNMIMKFMRIAERDTSMLAFVKQYEAEAYLLKKDTTSYVNALKEGFRDYPNFAYFFPRLEEYYEKMGENDSALVLADRALKADTTSMLFRFAKSTALLNLEKYSESIKLCKQIISENPEYADAYYNIGLAYFNQAIELDKNWQAREKRNKIIGYYSKAKSYMEKFRQLSPDSKRKWLAPLYTIYLNLNMGKEFDEIDKIRNEK